MTDAKEAATTQAAIDKFREVADEPRRAAYASRRYRSLETFMAALIASDKPISQILSDEPAKIADLAVRYVDELERIANE